MGTYFKYDVFISHSSKDKPTVRELAKKLKEDGIRVWLDEWEIRPGDMIGLKIEEGLEQSRTLILAMSANSFASDWVTLERHTVIFRDPTNAQRRFIPLRLDNTSIKDILRQFAYVDWRDNSAEEYQKLLAVCYQKEIEDDIPFRGGKSQKAAPSKILKGHTSSVMRVAISPDGSKAVSASGDKTIRVWNIEKGKHINTLKGHQEATWAVAMTANGKTAISGSHDKTIRIWDLETGKCIKILAGHTGQIRDIAVTPDGRLGASVSDDGAVYIWDINHSRSLNEFRTKESFWSVAISEDGKKVIAGSFHGNIQIWDVATARNILTLNADNKGVYGIAITKDGKKLVSAGDGKKIMIWDLETGICIAIFEGHTDSIWSVAISADGNRIVSGSSDKTVRVWDFVTGNCLSIFSNQSGSILCVSINAKGDRIISGSEDSTVRVWELPILEKIKTEQVVTTKRYTNAKVLLVGDSGVGKSGLAIRLTENRFVATTSTDGVWATHLKLPYLNTSAIEREVWLWDFAGQSDYRLIHQLFMDETSLALLVFNPQTDNPFEGLSQWTHDLQKAARRKFKKLLVAGRCDRGGITVTRASINDFHLQHNFSGYFETSANTGAGCVELRDAILNTIDWEDIPWTASPYIFQILKNEILKLKDEGKVLLRMSELKQQLEMRLRKEPYTIEELNAVVGLLAGPGLVWKLEFGNFILLEPERINAYAAAVIRKVRMHTEEIGIISEEDVLTGKLDFQDMKRLPVDEEQIILRAMHQTFVDHSLCLREQTEAGNLLVFPSYFKRERPDLESHPAVLVTYQFKGNLDEIYATLIVRLHHTPAFQKDQLWKFAADFKTQSNQKIGLKMTKLKEGTAEIAIYLEPKISDDTKVTFIKYVHDHIKAKASDIIRLRHYVCSHCGTPVADNKTVLKKVEAGKKDILCLDCEKRILLWDIIEEKFASEQMQQQVVKLKEEAQTSIDNESKELILVGHAFAIAGEAGQIFRPTPNADWGIDGEIEFKNHKGQASGKRIYLQLKSGNSYLNRKKDSKEIFKIKNQLHAEYWTSQPYPVMLVIRTSDNQIRWMNVTEYLNRSTGKTNEVIFTGEDFSVMNLLITRDRIMETAKA